MKAERKFLGKSLPKTPQVKTGSSRRKFGKNWTLLFSAPVLLFLGLSLAAPSSLQQSAPQQNDNLRQVRVLGATPPKCSDYKVSDLNNLDLFPLIPKEIATKDGCNPQSWNRTIFVFLTYKLLAILNYLAGAVAIIATIYGGILYLTGFASESTVKQAKSIIIGTYVGFAIILLARLLVQGSFYLFGTGSINFDDQLNYTEILSDEIS